MLAGRIPGLYIAVLGALKNGSVVTPLFLAELRELLQQPNRKHASKRDMSTDRPALMATVVARLRAIARGWKPRHWTRWTGSTFW